MISNYINLHRLFCKLITCLPTTNKQTYSYIITASKKFACVRDKYEQKLGKKITSSNEYILLKMDLINTIKNSYDSTILIHTNKNDEINLLYLKLDYYEKFLN